MICAWTLVTFTAVASSGNQVVVIFAGAFAFFGLTGLAVAYFDLLPVSFRRRQPRDVSRDDSGTGGSADTLEDALSREDNVLDFPTQSADGLQDILEGKRKDPAAVSSELDPREIIQETAKRKKAVSIVSAHQTQYADAIANIAANLGASSVENAFRANQEAIKKINQSLVIPQLRASEGVANIIRSLNVTPSLASLAKLNAPSRYKDRLPS